MTIDICHIKNDEPALRANLTALVGNQRGLAFPGRARPEEIAQPIPPTVKPCHLPLGANKLESRK